MTRTIACAVAGVVLAASIIVGGEEVWNATFAGANLTQSESLVQSMAGGNSVRSTIGNGGESSISLVVATTTDTSPTTLTEPSAPATEADGDEYALYVWDLDSPALEVPLAFAEGVSAVWLGCEVRGANLTPYADLAAVRGAALERGQAQIHPIHFPRMRAMGLDPDYEGDLVQFGVIKWAESESFSAWSCSR